MLLLVDQCRGTNKHLKNMKLVFYYSLIFSLISVLARGQTQGSSEEKSLTEDSREVTSLAQDSREVASQTEDSRKIKSQVQDLRELRGQGMNLLLGPNVKRSIQNYVAASMLNIMPVSTILENAQILFFESLEKETNMAVTNHLKPNVSSECLDSMREFVKGLKEMRIWAIEMVDSFGKIPSGILEGTVNAFGDYDQCVNANVPGKFQGHYCRLAVRQSSKNSGNTSFDFTPIDVSYAYNRNSSKTLLEMSAEGGVDGLKYFPITTSICVPSTCNVEEVRYLLATVNKPNQDALNIAVHDCLLKKELNLTSTQKAILTAIMVLILFEVFATMIDFRISSIHPDEEYRSTLKLSTKCLLSFSYRTNAIRLFKRDDNPDSIKIFHGMKFLTMAWIILGHSILYNTNVLSRLLDGVRLAGRFFFQIAINSFAAPDTFFFISGFLVVYSNMKLNLPKIPFVYFVLYRYLRLVPPIMFIIGVWILSASIDQGPLFKEHVFEEFIDHCDKLWWKNILCINNYSGVDGECMPWTWYIAVDLQLYVLCYFLLNILRRNPKRVLFILKTTVVASVFYLMAYYVHYDLPPVPFLIYIAPKASLYYTKIAHVRPDPHIGSYCVGILMGYYIATQKKINLSRSKIFIGWSLSILFGGFVVFATYLWNSGRVATTLESALYGGFHRLLWCLMISWITYMCINENGGVVQSVLSWYGFVPLGRLTYMAYLLHPIIIILCFGRFRHSIAADQMFLAYAFISFTFVTYFLSFIFCMICEAPITALLSVLISSKVRKNGVNSIKKRKESFSV